MAFWLANEEPGFPPPHLAEPDGLLAVGGAIEPEWLVLAYRYGIFPWFEQDDFPFWYTPDPRLVLFPAELKVHKSMRSIFNQNRFRYTLDTCFERVMRACAGNDRRGAAGTWISENFIQGYTALHEKGLAHSVEVWEGDELVGGLYGVSLGKVFYGESMFAEVSNASKAGFIQFAQALHASAFTLIDCQQETPHLSSLGARSISRDVFMDYLELNAFERSLVGKWSFGPDGGIECA